MSNNADQISSITEIETTTKSKVFHESAKYSFGPNAKSLLPISTVKMPRKR